MTTPPLCEQCNASGLPILPVRYAPMPKAVGPALPGWAGANRVKDVPLGDDYQYALRTLRAGYVYLFYSKNAFGSNQWECYVATMDGQLLRQPDPSMAVSVPGETVACSRIGHSKARLRHLVIEKPEKCGATWIAFSEHKWSDEAIHQYTTDTHLRNARMQTLNPAQMAAGAKHSHGTPASQAALEQVVDYASGDAMRHLPFDGATGTFSKEDGSFDAARLPRLSTRYPWCARQGEADGDVDAMQHRAAKAGGKHNTAHVIALWDAVGITHELNGWRNDAAGWLKKYGEERELQISALQAVDGLQKALDKKIKDGWDDTAAHVKAMPDLQENSMRFQAVTRYAKSDPAELGQPLAKLDEQYNAGQIPDAAYRAQRSQVFAAHSSNPAAMEAAYARIDQHRRELAQARTTNLAKNKQDDIARTWSKYSERLDQSALGTFKSHWQSLLGQADAIIDRRTQSLVAWLEAPLFIDTLEDFHPACDADGVLFEDTIGNAIFGMGSCKSGAAKLDAWVKEAKANVKNNLLWRAIALNQQEGADEVGKALKIAYGAQAGLTLEAFEHAASQIKWNKIFDLGKKSLTVFNTQKKALADPKAIIPLERTHGLEKIFLTVNGRWVKPFKWTVDTVNEKILQMLLQVRSGVDPLKAKALAAWETVHDAQDREALIRRLRNQDYYLSQAAKADYEEKAKKWAALRADVEVPDAKKQSFNAARDARLALIVAVFEAFNLYKASAKAAASPGNEKAQAQLTAAKLATTSAFVDVVSNMVKGLAAAGDKAASYQILKLGGGALSVVASSYGAVMDVEDFDKEVAHQDYRMATLLVTRAIFQFTSAALTALTALSYCSPLIETFGKQFGERLAGRIALAAAERLLLARAALVFASLEVSIFVLAVTLLIWYFEDDALQKWCDRSAFGSHRKDFKDAYGKAETQLDAYGKSLKEAM